MKPVLEEHSQLQGASAIAAMLCAKTISNDALVPEHPRLGCYTLGIKSCSYYLAAKLIGDFLEAHNYSNHLSFM